MFGKKSRRFGNVGLVVSKLLVAIALVLFGATMWPTVANAHASVSSTSPEAGSTVARSPKEVTITFDQGISVPTGGVRILNEQAERIGAQKPRFGSKVRQANTVSVAIPPLRSGAYVVSWRAVSEDGHPIRGAFTFRVGSSGNQAVIAKLARELLTNGKADPALSLTMAIARALNFASLLLLLGGVSYVLFLRTHAPGNDLRVSKLLNIAATVAGFSGLVAVVTFGPYAAGEGFGGLSDGNLLGDTISSSVGRSMILRSVAMVTLGFLLLRILSTLVSDRTASWGDGTSVEPSNPGKLANRKGKASAKICSATDRAALVGLSGVILGLSTFIGHGATGRWRLLGAIETGLHIGAASSWIGVLVLVLAATSGARTTAHASNQGPQRTGSRHTKKPKPNQPLEPTTEEVLCLIERFSTLAFWSVAVLVISGILNGVRQTGAVTALTSTNYGRLLLTKVGIVLLIVGLGWLSQRSLGQRRAAIAERSGHHEAKPLDHFNPAPSDPSSTKRLPPALVAIRRRMMAESLSAITIR